MTTQEAAAASKKGGKAKRPVYLDNHATTRPDPLVVEAMMPYLTEIYGNASSTDHVHGHDAAEAVEEARRHVAALVNARPNEIVFTSGATESNNMAIVGAMERYKDRGDHMVTCETEHMAVLGTARHLEGKGKRVTYLPVDEYGIVEAGSVRDAITDRTVLVSIMAANNEIGSIPDIKAIGGITRKAGVLFHTDAAQAAGHMPIDVQSMNIDLMSLSAHKMHGAKGAGALYVRGTSPRVTIVSLLHGGGQERSMRSGTLNVPAIVGFGKAAEIAQTSIASDTERLVAWSSMIRREISAIGGRVLGHPDRRLARNICAMFPGIDGKAIINTVSGTLAISAGSACTTQTVKPSHVLLATGLTADEAHSTIRIGLSKFNSDADIDLLISEVAAAVRHLRGIENKTGRTRRQGEGGYV